MKMKKTLIILLMFCFLPPVYSQNMQLSESHVPTNSTIGYVVDFLKLDSATFFSIGQFQRSQIKRVRTNDQNSEIIVTTRLLAVLNGELLSTTKDKTKLSTINLDDIELITIMDKDKAIENYGKKGKNGVLYIITKTF